MIGKLTFSCIGRNFLAASIPPRLIESRFPKHLEQGRSTNGAFSTSQTDHVDPAGFDGYFRRVVEKSSIKKRYLRKFPLVRTTEDGTITVEGVSNKQMPCPVPWKEPPLVERWTPGEHSSGDMGDLNSLSQNGPLDISQPRLEYQKSKEYMEAPAEVKRVLSIEFGKHKDIRERIKHDLARKVQEHPLDFYSLPVGIANLTVKIRNDQAALEKLNQRLPPYNKRNQARKHDLKISIDHRRTMLAYLRQRDYKKFEWLLEVLNIVYKPRPMENWEKVERRKHQDRLTDLWCDELRTHRLNKFKQELEQKQPDFLRYKATVLAEILEEEKELINKKLIKEPSVTKSEIEETYKRASDIEAKLAKGDRSEKEYYIYEEKIVSDDLIFVK